MTALSKAEVVIICLRNCAEAKTYTVGHPYILHDRKVESCILIAAMRFLNPLRRFLRPYSYYN